MSIQTYNKILQFDGRAISFNPETGAVESTGSLVDGMAMEFQANIKVLSGRDRYKVRSTNV